MPHMNPVDPAAAGSSGPADSINYGVQAVSDDSINALHPGGAELVDQLRGELLGHGCSRVLVAD